MNTIIETNKVLENVQDISKIINYLNINGLTTDIKGKIYPNKIGFRRMCIYFGISLEIVRESRVEHKEDFLYEFTVRATDKEGRYIECSASCSSRERNYSNPENDVRATAQTRASNRAISELLGISDISSLLGKEHNKDYENTNYKRNEINNTNIYSNSGEKILITDKQKNLIIKLYNDIYGDDDLNDINEMLNEMTKSEANQKIKELINLKENGEN